MQTGAAVGPGLGALVYAGLYAVLPEAIAWRALFAAPTSLSPRPAANDAGAGSAAFVCGTLLSGHAIARFGIAVAVGSMPDFLPRQRWPLASCQTGTDDLPTRFGPNVRRWGTGGSQTHPWREMDSNFRFRASGDTPHRPRGEAASHRSRLPLRRDPPLGRP